MPRCKLRHLFEADAVHIERLNTLSAAYHDHIADRQRTHGLRGRAVVPVVAVIDAIQRHARLQRRSVNTHIVLGRKLAFCLLIGQEQIVRAVLGGRNLVNLVGAVFVLHRRGELFPDADSGAVDVLHPFVRLQQAFAVFVPVQHHADRLTAVVGFHHIVQEFLCVKIVLHIPDAARIQIFDACDRAFPADVIHRSFLL